MRVSARVDYAVRALTELAAADTGPLKGEAIAKSQAIPFNFLENILGDLRRAGIVASQRGTGGGYWLSAPADSVTIADVVRIVEGPLADVRGVPPEALDYTGPAASLREVWVATRANLRAVLEAVTIGDLAQGRLPDQVAQLVRRSDVWARRQSAARAP